MIVVMEKRASRQDVERVTEQLRANGFGVHLSEGVEHTVIGVIGDKQGFVPDSLLALPAVDKVVEVLDPYKLVNKDFTAEKTVLQVQDTQIGGADVVIMAGPCAVESEEQLMGAARGVSRAGGRILRGGAFKPRTSPYSFQGLGEDGLRLLARARERFGTPIITEVMSPEDVELVGQYADIFQIGARNMQNYPLLRAVGCTDKPVMLKRGMSATFKEWFLAAEYVMAGGNHNVMLCERGIRTFETETRNTLDLSAVVVAKENTHLPVIVDPSHGTGKWNYVPAMARAAVAAGADGLIVEVHPDPENALSDGQQSLTPSRFGELVRELDAVARAVGRSVLSEPETRSQAAGSK
jgi:3-deoxy-7-phosphoheptulonate synthase